MGKGLNRERRRQKQQREQILDAHPPKSAFQRAYQSREPDNVIRTVDLVAHENPPASLRLVRSKDKFVPSEPIAARQPDKTVSSVPEPERGHDLGGKEAVGHSLDTGVDLGSDDLPSVIRSFDATKINELFNNQAIFPLIAVPGSDTIDVSPLVAETKNVLLIVDGGGVLFVWQEPGIYEVHSAFLENSVKSLQSANRWMFTHTDCMKLLTRVPKINPQSEDICKSVGAVKEFERKELWQTADGLVDMGFWSLGYDAWVRGALYLKESGKKFYARLNEERQRLGHEDFKPQEDCYELPMGACAEMIYGGQMDKGIALYNMWARFSGYGMIALVAHDPAIINVGDSLLQITGDTFKVIVVR